MSLNVCCVGAGVDGYMVVGLTGRGLGGTFGWIISKKWWRAKRAVLLRYKCYTKSEGA